MTSSEDEPAEIPTEPESITATSANNDETIENEESSPSPLFASESDADPSPDGLLPSAVSSEYLFVVIELYHSIIHLVS